MSSSSLASWRRSGFELDFELADIVRKAARIDLALGILALQAREIRLALVEIGLQHFGMLLGVDRLVARRRKVALKLRDQRVVLADHFLRRLQFVAHMEELIAHALQFEAQLRGLLGHVVKLGFDRFDALLAIANGALQALVLGHQQAVLGDELFLGVIKRAGLGLEIGKRAFRERDHHALLDERGVRLLTRPRGSRRPSSKFRRNAFSEPRVRRSCERRRCNGS